MATCKHCGTTFHPASPEEIYCCRGCEYVAHLIDDQGFDRFYDLRGGATTTPVRSRPFEDHDFSWLDARLADAEARAAARHGPATLDLGLEGISCVGCVWLVERVFSRHPGALHASANPAIGHLHLEWLPGVCDIPAYLRELTSFGYVAAPRSSASADGEVTRLSVRLGLCGAFALNTMAFSLPGYWGMTDDFEFAPLFRLIAFISATLSMLVGGSYFITRAWRSVQVKSLHIDLPIALGLITAYCGSLVGWVLARSDLVYFDFVSTFVFLMLLGRHVQTLAIEKNRRRMVRAQPLPDDFPSADNGAKRIARDSLAAGSLFMLGPGQALPVAAILSNGTAEFSLEWIHGEADPVTFQTGSHLPSGAILLSKSPAALEATEAWEDSLISRLTAPPSAIRNSPWLDRILRVYLSCVILIGLATLLAWGTRGDWLHGAQAMISVFVVSCPCAIGLAIPLADDLAASAMEKLGVFIRNTTLWSRLLRVRHILFDKTGTLTLERPVLLNPEAIPSLDESAALALARLTRGSLHPLARTLLEALGVRGQTLLAAHGAVPVTDFPGFGVSLDDQDATWSLGKIGWQPTDRAEPVQATEAPGSELRKDGALVATFHFRECLRPAAVSILRQLSNNGQNIHILSGDHRDKVLPLAESLGVSPENAHHGLSPTEKESIVRSIGRHDTLYLGDGANDSLAFDAALVTGTPVVDRSLLEGKSDFYTLGSSLAYLPSLFRTARLRANAIRAAFSFTILYNLATVTLAASGRMNPVLAAILMPLSSVISITIVVMLMRSRSSHRNFIGKSRSEVDIAHSSS